MKRNGHNHKAFNSNLVVSPEGNKVEIVEYILTDGSFHRFSGTPVEAAAFVGFEVTGPRSRRPMVWVAEEKCDSWNPNEVCTRKIAYARCAHWFGVCNGQAVRVS